jgi:predicted outer membrane repeat protein
MMRIIQLAMACVAVLVVTAGQVQAGLITTLFARNNTGNNGGAVYFDINVLNPAGITIEKLFTNTNDSFVLGNMNVYTRSGTSSGFQTGLAGWTLVSSGLGNSAGDNNPSEFDVTDFSLGVGVTGISIVSSSSSWGHSYTNGNGSNQFYSNSDLSLTLGSASNAPFTAPTLNPRVWNGTIQYSVPSSAAVPEPSPLTMFAIGACATGIGAARRRRREKHQEATA